MEKSRFECSRDGLAIRGSVRLPDTGKYPVFILSHGFMADESSCGYYADVLAGMGYAAVTFDFCGGSPTGKSDGRSEDMTVATQVRDLETVIGWAKKQSFFQGEISLLGLSQGGFVSAIAAKKHPEISQLALLYPALCIPDDARRGQMLGFSFDPQNMPEILMQSPMKISRRYAEAVMDWDFREKIRGYEGKTLIIHGRSDEIVNIRYAREAKGLYKDCRYYEIEGGGHGFDGEYLRQAIAAMKKEL